MLLSNVILPGGLSQGSSTKMFIIELSNTRSNFEFIMVFMIFLRSVYSIYYNHRILYVFILVE